MWERWVFHPILARHTRPVDALPEPQGLSALDVLDTHVGCPHLLQKRLPTLAVAAEGLLLPAQAANAM